jgi:hypothetical protein
MDEGCPVRSPIIIEQNALFCCPDASPDRIPVSFSVRSPITIKQIALFCCPDALLDDIPVGCPVRSPIISK